MPSKFGIDDDGSSSGKKKARSPFYEKLKKKGTSGEDGAKKLSASNPFRNAASGDWTPPFHLHRHTPLNHSLQAEQHPRMG